MNSSNPLLDAALAYANRGLPVFPLQSCANGLCSCGDADCDSPGKHPRNANGLTGGTCDPERIVPWWEMWPDSNIGLVTGEVSGITVVDVDGDEGRESFEALKGVTPDTRIHRTPHGRHHLFEYTPAVKTGSGITCPPYSQISIAIRIAKEDTRPEQPHTGYSAECEYAGQIST